MAVSGEPLCTSAYNGFLLTLKYCDKFYFALKLANLFVALGVLAVVSLNTALSWISF